MDFDDAAAERLEATYLGHDVIQQRTDTLALLDIAPGEHVVDIGSGPGFLAQGMAHLTGDGGRVVGVDLSPALIRRATARAEASWLSYVEGDATALPFDDASFDIAVSTQVAEYVPDIAALCTEMARVLKPGGRGLVMATDWGGVVWQSSDPERMARVLEAFEPHCANPRLPRTLAPHLRKAGLVVDEVSAFPIVNLDMSDGTYSRGMAGFIAGYVRNSGTLPEAEIDAWLSDLRALSARGDYFMSTTRFSFLVTKPA
ncbi:methyltransferase domain-containing protein [Chachezhania antarctica]|uniref:methyltransferase domain-containing protein n=1 Tax=Chachezhania antarctica TaxID=2340860 RepID=UPI000EAEDAF2|nr:methyltransferase domain-containing protein [Chachezhania antarctica]|tara:strand:+ start:17536 stop:18309 length:774 start_codon:yes stop_codon:yes gene_type:complete